MIEIMNRIFKFFGIAAVVAFAASCANVEYQEYPYVTLVTTSLSVNENVGTVDVTLASHNLNGKTVTATLEIVDGTAKNGTNISLSSPTVTFNGDEQKTVSVSIIDNPGVYTGTLSCRINLSGASDGAEIGSFNSVKVNIKDLDHPLADVLGTYTAVDGDGASWEVTVEADPNNTSKVLVKNIDNYTAKTISFPGVVSEDHSVIEISNQVAFTYSGYDIKLVALTQAGSFNRESTDPFVFKKNADGNFECEDGIISLAFSGGTYLGYFNYAWGPIVWKK